MDGKYFWPGAKKDRKDKAEIPPDKEVDFQGHGTNELTGWMVLGELIVNGTLRAKSAKTPIMITAEGPVTVGASGTIGGVSPGAGGKKKKLPIHLASTKDTIGIHGTVEGENGSVSVTAKKNVSISGKVNSKGKGTKVESKSESVNLTGGGIIAGDKTVKVQSGAGKPTRIYCKIESRKGDVEINGGRKKKAGDVYIGKGDSVIAAGEVIIRADSLYIGGTIKAKTIKKYARVTVIDSTGSIEGKLNTKDKIDTIHATREKSDGRPAEKSNDCRITGMSGSVINFKASPGAIEAQSYCKIVGGTIDLRNNPPGWLVITCYGVTELFADNILLDPGTMIESICGPGPVLVNPSAPAYDVSATVSESGTGYPTMKTTVKFLVANMGNIDDSYTINVINTLGWPQTLSDNSMTLDADDPMDSIVTVTLDVPIWAIPDIDTNYVIINVASITDPTAVYSETTYVSVQDTNMLRQNSVTWYDIENGCASDTTEVYSLLMNVNELVDSGIVIVNDSLGWELLTSLDTIFLASNSDSVFLTRAIIPGDAFDGMENAIYMEYRSIIDTGTVDFDTVRITVGDTIGVGTEIPFPGAIGHWIYPNPFNPRVTISMSIPDPGGMTRIDIFDVSGRFLRRVFEGRLSPGVYKRYWDGLTKNGSRAASGVYFYRITVEKRQVTGKLVLLK